MPRQTLSGHFYVPIMSAAGVDEMLATIEAVVPTPRLEWRVDDAGEVHEVASPGRWVMQQMTNEDIGLICNGSERQLVSLEACHSQYEPRDDPLFHVGVDLWRCPPSLLDLGFDLACRFGPAARAYKGAMYTEAAKGLVKQNVDSARRRSLPLAHPHVIGWINYWSAETCALVEFSHADPRCALFARVERCEGGGVAFQLTDEPLDLTDPAHRATLDAAWNAFPTIPRKPGRPRPTA